MSESATATYEWNQLPWRKLEVAVFKLERRIYKASHAGDIRRVHRLQKLLLKSRAAKLLAVRRVTQDNQGKSTAGIDGIKALTPPNVVPWRLISARCRPAAPPDGCGFQSRAKTTNARCRFPHSTIGHSKPSLNSSLNRNGKHGSNPTAMDSDPDDPSTTPSVRSSSRLRSSPSTPWT